MVALVDGKTVYHQTQGVRSHSGEPVAPNVRGENATYLVTRTRVLATIHFGQNESVWRVSASLWLV